MKIIPLDEGNYSVNKNKEFSVLTESSPATDLKMAIRPFLIITQHDYLLLDVGLGEAESHQQQSPIYRCLEAQGIHPTQITKIWLSHLHKDHIAGLWRTEGGQLEANFPQAQIYLQERELEYALQQVDAPNYNIALLEKLNSLPNKVTL